jgi:hypothetical protein
MRSKYLLVFFIFGLSCSAVYAQTFQFEEEIKPRVKAPAGILKLLGKEPNVADCLKDNKLDPVWFEVARIDLNGDKFADYVVKEIGDERCYLAGANIVTWLVFKGSARGFEKVFHEASFSWSLDSKKKTNGFRNIETDSFTAVKEITGWWVFNGKKYKFLRSRVRKL